MYTLINKIIISVLIFFLLTSTASPAFVNVPHHKEFGGEIVYMEAKEFNTLKTLLVSPVQFITDVKWWDKDREYRTKVVYDTLCKSGGWWGSGCIDEKSLVSWLLFEEGATLSYTDKVNMTKGIRYRFKYFGDTDTKFIRQLSAYTAFFNPDGDDDLDGLDWKALINPSINLKEYREIVDIVYSTEVKGNDGLYMYWWAESEIVTPKGKWPGKYIQTSEAGYGLFYFSGIPNVRTCAISNKNCN